MEHLGGASPDVFTWSAVASFAAGDPKGSLQPGHGRPGFQGSAEGEIGEAPPSWLKRDRAIVVFRMKTALYLRVSTIEQSTENELPDLEALAKRRGFDIVRVLEPNGFGAPFIRS